MTPIKFILEIMHKKNRLIASSLILTIMLIIITHLLIYIGIIPQSLDVIISCSGGLLISFGTTHINNRMNKKIMATMYDRMMEENYEFTTAMYDHKIYTEPQIVPVLMMTSKFIREKMEDKMHDKIGGA